MLAECIVIAVAGVLSSVLLAAMVWGLWWLMDWPARRRELWRQRLRALQATGEWDPGRFARLHDQALARLVAESERRAERIVRLAEDCMQVQLELDTAEWENES